MAARPLTPNQRRMLAAIIRQDDLKLGTATSMNVLRTLRDRKLLAHDVIVRPSEWGELALPLEAVERVFRERLPRDRMETSSGIRLEVYAVDGDRAGELARRAEAAGFLKADQEAAVQAVLEVLEEEGKVDGWTLDRSRFDVDPANDDDHAGAKAKIGAKRGEPYPYWVRWLGDDEVRNVDGRLLVDELEADHA